MWWGNDHLPHLEPMDKALKPVIYAHHNNITHNLNQCHVINRKWATSATKNHWPCHSKVAMPRSFNGWAPQWVVGQTWCYLCRLDAHYSTRTNGTRSHVKLHHWEYSNCYKGVRTKFVERWIGTNHPKFACICGHCKCWSNKDDHSLDMQRSWIVSHGYSW